MLKLFGFRSDEVVALKLSIYCFQPPKPCKARYSEIKEYDLTGGYVSGTCSVMAVLDRKLIKATFANLHNGKEQNLLRPPIQNVNTYEETYLKMITT